MEKPASALQSRITKRKRQMMTGAEDTRNRMRGQGLGGPLLPFIQDPLSNHCLALSRHSTTKMLDERILAPEPQVPWSTVVSAHPHGCYHSNILNAAEVSEFHLKAQFLGKKICANQIISLDSISSNDSFLHLQNIYSEVLFALLSP